MHNVLGWLSRLVTARPWLTLLALLLVTILMMMGSDLREPPLDTEGTLPRDSAVARAMAEIDELFGDSGEVRVVTLLFRGDALTPAGLSQMDALLNDVAVDPEVAEILAPGFPFFAPTLLVKSALQVDSFESVTQEQIDSTHGVPGIGETLASFTGTDADGTPVAVGSIRLHDTADQRVVEAERRISELVTGSDGPLRVSSISFVVIEDEVRRGTEGMGPLIGLALLLIAGLIVLFMRSISDLLLTLLGLFVSIMWIVGIEGWLGPKGLGLVGPPNTLTAMVPIVVIGLTVDYAIQAVSHYREQRVAGEAVASAARVGLRNVTVPLMLAAVTTIVSLMVGLFSPVEIVGDFGIIGGLGVGMSLIVMLTLIPAGRTIIDRRREARGRLGPARPISTALPGIDRTAGFLGRQITRRPAPYIAAVLAVTLVLGFAARDLHSEFSIRDLLPGDGTVLEDIATLDAAVGGSTENTSVLLRAEATETRTLLNLHELRDVFEDEGRRPAAAAGPLQISYELLVEDWTHASGAPGDKYDPALEALFMEATSGVRLDPVLMQELLDRIGASDPALRHNLVNDPDGVDTILLQFPASTGDPGASKRLQEDVEAVWPGDDGALTATSDSIISFAVTDAIRDRQTESIGTTIAAALVVLTLFFWLTVRQPALAVIAVVPTVLVLISVLGTMALLGIPYTITTSIITALSIGIGVDYTIHMIHRYREEFARLRSPERAAVRTLSITGSALLGSALTTALGIGVMAFSPLAAMQQFGITAAITIAYSLLFSVLLVPPAMTVWGAFQNMRLRSATERQWAELDVAIEEIYHRHEQEEDAG
ncbi:MAG: MMPL family transporter [Chloroflexota bacterium]|nr:MMPL family transporter [Chloroflexota bacterium]MDE2884548.1 MMPL family transporter [Chloroflexota bacterium]